MRLISIAVLAAASVAVALPTIASAEDFYVGGPGVGIEVGRHHDRDWRDDHYRTDGFYRHERYDRCRTTIIRRDDGSVRRIKRCRD